MGVDRAEQLAGILDGPVDEEDVSARLRRVREVLLRVRYKDWIFLFVPQKPFAYLQLCWPAPCSETGVPRMQRSRKWLLSPHMTLSEIVQTAFLAVKTAEEHELREAFRYRGEAIFGPHFDVDALHGIAEAKDVR